MIPSMWRAALLSLLLAGIACSLQESVIGPPAQPGVVPSDGEIEIPPAVIRNDEGGPVVIRGEVSYTNPFFSREVAQPLIILEDQAGFVDRDRGFLFPVASQTLGQITSDFDMSPFSYSLALPLEPQGSLRDVDNDGASDPGVMIFAVAYWNNVFGDPYLERRDLGGGGWSTAYASTRTSEDADTLREIVGGSLLIYAPDDEQAFPAGFGEDGLLFTPDDPVLRVPAGYTLVNLDRDPFRFDRSREVEVNLFEPEGAALVSFAELNYVDAFDGMLDKLRREYAFTEHKAIDWEALAGRYRPRIEQAQRDRSSLAYQLALRDFLWSIPDGHVGFTLTSNLRAQRDAEIAGGLGLAIRELDDGRAIVHILIDEGPADRAGIQRGAEIIAVNGQPIADVIGAVRSWRGPFSTTHVERLEQARQVMRFPVGEAVQLRIQNPDDDPQDISLTAIAEWGSYNQSSLQAGRDPLALPVEYELLPSGYGYVQMTSFFDNDVLTVMLWERMIRAFKEANVPGIVIDMRQNGGGRGYLADQMAAYFFDQEWELGNSGAYNESLGAFYFDPDTVDVFYPPDPALRYEGELAILVGPACASACEFFAYNMTIQGRALIVGHMPSAGLGGSVEDFRMPDGITVRFTIGRAVDMNGEIHIEGRGVVPDLRVPLTRESVLGEQDSVLNTAIDALDATAGR
ncbi:MAG: peptidase S41 [Chloroflexi bacterium]|nr:peptidase S41 [Chloroflexota bacterium]